MYSKYPNADHNNSCRSNIALGHTTENWPKEGMLLAWQPAASLTLLPHSLVAVWSVALDLQGPLFIQEPPHRVEFSNSSGGRVDCSAHGSPPPELGWSLGDGTPVVQVPALRLLQANGSLVFPPFPAELYRHDIHTALYRCKARNQMGQIVSRDVHVRAGESVEVCIVTTDIFVIPVTKVT
jgi:hypothetical protein